MGSLIETADLELIIHIVHISQQVERYSYSGKRVSG